jgi:hypothetical protein
MKIQIDPFDRKSIGDAVKLVKQYKRDFLVKEQEFARRLADLGVRVAQAGFATADYDGVNDVVVTLVKTSTGYAVLASGEKVGFIEFGTGIRYPEWDNTDMAYTPPVHGTYGKGQGKNPWGWWFKAHDGAMARHTYGNPPAEAMRTARDEMVAQVIQIAREVWK